MLRIGLTGGIACGKTTVARMFGDLGCKLINADAVGHEVIRKPQPAYHEIIEAFGSGVLGADDEIDRTRLGNLVFSDREKLYRLNAIVHPRIFHRSDHYIQKMTENEPEAIVVVEAALIYEANGEGRFQKMVAAWCRSEQQIERLQENPGLSAEDAERRIASQMSSDEKRKRADYAIDCSGTLEATRRQVEEVYRQLSRLAKQSGAA